MNQEIIPINLGAVNCYLVKQGNSFILFDTGGYIILDKEINNRQEMLERELDKAGCNSENLKLIVLTHGDYDHSANAAYIREKYKTKIAMHKGDLNLVEKPNLEDVMKSFSYRSVFLKMLFCILKKKIESINIKILGHFRGFKPDIFLNDGETLHQYGLDAKIIHIPGHTPGSIAILTQNGQLIAGDIFANTQKPKASPNALDFPAMDKSIEVLGKLDIKTVYPGHGKPFKMDEYK